MRDNRTFTATLDRIEEGIAVILVEDEGEVFEEKYIHELERIPEASRHEGAVLTVAITDGEIDTIDYDAEVEKRRRDRIQDRFDRLSERPPDRDSDGRQ